MNAPRFPLAVPLFGARDANNSAPGGNSDVPAIERLRMVLETRRGTVPWRPELGLGLDDLLGEPLTPVQLTLVRHRLTAALAAALPGARVVQMELSVRTRLGASEQLPRTLPVAERSLVPFGTEAELVADLTVQTPAGFHSFSIDLNG